MNLLSLKRELEQLKALARARRGSDCVCEYVEVLENRLPTTEQQQLIERNRDCYQRSKEGQAHVGFSYVLVPPAN